MSPLLRVPQAVSVHLHQLSRSQAAGQTGGCAALREACAAGAKGLWPEGSGGGTPLAGAAAPPFLLLPVGGAVGWWGRCH